jgi:hypothetical protein
MHTETFRNFCTDGNLPSQLFGININQERGYEATEKEETTMHIAPNRSAIHETPLKSIELSADVYYAPDKSLVVRAFIPHVGAEKLCYKLAEFKGKLSMENANVVTDEKYTVVDLVPATKQTLEVQELQPGDVVLLSRGWGYIISVTKSSEDKDSVVVRYIELDGTLRVEILAQETYTTAVLSFDDSIYGSPAFKKFVFEDVLRPMNVISNGNTNRALAVYRIVDKVEFLGEKRTTDLLNAELAAACYRTWE